MAHRSKRIIWVDCEMTGLDANKDHLVEIACVITEGDKDLNIVEKGPDIVIHQSEEVLAGMSDWCKEHFSQNGNGLTERIRQSNISLAEAEKQVLEFVRRETPPGVCPLGGNSVHEDRQFIRRHMPQLYAHLHHRIIDVSTIKELCRRWYPNESALKPKKKSDHRAMGDILESIEELRFYQKMIFR